MKDRLVMDAVYIEQAIEKQINRLLLCRRKITYLLDQKVLSMVERQRLQHLIEVARRGMEEEEDDDDA